MSGSNQEIIDQHSNEVRNGKRFEFGKNWNHFLRHINDQRIESAMESLRSMLGAQDLSGKKFLDAGCGSGLFSLAARNLGAEVFSFDYDPYSYACTVELKERYFKDDNFWRIERGSVLDVEYMQSLGKFDVVYSWGVLHHTGDMKKAIYNTLARVSGGGLFFMALYNDQGWISHYWASVKKAYNKIPLLRPILVIFHLPYLFLGRYLTRLFTGRLHVQRGMTLWYDMIDWLGGWPYEVSKPTDIRVLLEAHGFGLIREKLVGNRSGCNEFVFLRQGECR